MTEQNEIWSIPLLLTASVDTRGMEGALFTSLEREKMYAETLNYYISLISKYACKGAIVFAENSGWNLDVFSRQNILKNENIEVEYISLDPSLFDQSKGKSYNELLMIDLTLKISKLINKSGYFIKLTGRFPILNIDAIMMEYFRRGGKEIEFFGDSHDHKIYDWLKMPINGHSAESRIWLSSLSFYKDNIEGQYKNLNDYDGRNVESFLLSIIRKYKSSPYLIGRFRIQPHFTGKGGHNLGNGPAFFYSTDNDSLALTIKRSIRQLFRWITPWLWI
jgi:hypothetical protein